MAKTQSGLFALGASGSIGGALTFASWKGRQYARRLVVPSNPNTPAQRSVRASLSWGSKEWAQLTAPQQLTWEAAAKARNYLPFNAFVSQGQRNMAQDLGFQIEDPNVPVAAPTVATVPAATGGKGQASLTWTDGVGAQNFGYIVYALLGGAVTPGPQVIYALVDQGEQAVVIPNLAAGTWHFAIKTFATDAELSAATADFTAVVT